MAKNKTERISVRVSKAEKRQLRRAAKLANISEPVLVRQVIGHISSEIIARSKAGHPIFSWLDDDNDNTTENTPGL